MSRTTVKERLDGRERNEDFEALILDVVEKSYGTIGRGYLETRLRMAGIFEATAGGTHGETTNPDVR